MKASASEVEGVIGYQAATVAPSDHDEQRRFLPRRDDVCRERQLSGPTAEIPDVASRVVQLEAVGFDDLEHDLPCDAWAFCEDLESEVDLRPLPVKRVPLRCRAHADGDRLVDVVLEEVGFDQAP